GSAFRLIGLARQAQSDRQGSQPARLFFGLCGFPHVPPAHVVLPRRATYWRLEQCAADARRSRPIFRFAAIPPRFAGILQPASSSTSQTVFMGRNRVGVVLPRSRSPCAPGAAAAGLVPGAAAVSEKVRLNVRPRGANPDLGSDRWYKIWSAHGAN